MTSERGEIRLPKDSSLTGYAKPNVSDLKTIHGQVTLNGFSRMCLYIYMYVYVDHVTIISNKKGENDHLRFLKWGVQLSLETHFVLIKNFIYYEGSALNSGTCMRLEAEFMKLYRGARD